MQGLTARELVDLFEQSNGICTDTRQMKDRALFVCLRGESFNGNKFARQAAQANALKVIVDDPEYYDPERMILVDNSLKALQDLAQFYRHTLSIPFIGITGTNGKTTTKELVAAVLAKKFKTAATKGNFNNHIGVPLTLLSISRDDEIAVIEMGANHVGEIEDLCKLSDPDVGLITSIGKAHLEGFGSFQGVIQAKTELYHHIKHYGEHLFVNADNELLMEHAGNISKTTYGQGAGANVRASLSSAAPFLKLHWNGHDIQTQLVGAYNFDNVMAAISIGLYFGVSEEDIVDALQSYEPQNKRSQYIETDTNKVIMDAYNANPTSMELALKSFEEQDFANKWLVLGDMLELGQDSGEEHLKLMKRVQAMELDKALFVGPEFKRFEGAFDYSCFTDVEELNTFLQSNPPEGATLLIKGSRGIQLEKILDYI